MGRVKKGTTIETRLEQRKRVAANGCWEWTGYLNETDKNGGYGVIYYNGKCVKVHRLSWSLANGREPKKGLCICHHCDNRKCFNPAHLYEGTYQDNTRDMWDRGRANAPAGVRNIKAKITDATVKKIFEMKWRGISNQDIGMKLNISKCQVGKILNRQCWGHVEIDEMLLTYPETVMDYSKYKNHNKNKTHCKNGHPLSGDNIMSVNAGYGRLCKICRKAYMKKWNKNK